MTHSGEPKPGAEPGSDWQRALSDAVGHVAKDEAAAAAAARTQPQSRRGAVSVALVALVLVIGWDAWRFTRPAPLPSPDEQAYALRRSVGAVAREVLAIRAAEGTPPPRARVAYMLDDALTYQRVGTGFRITNTDGEYVVSYDGSVPVDQWVAGGGFRLEGRTP